jgi:hypothetical protein
MDGGGNGGGVSAALAGVRREGRHRAMWDWKRGGISDIFPSRAHMSELANGRNQIEDGRNGVLDKRDKCHDT